MTILIDKAAGKVWTEQLDSGQYEQCSGHLKDAVDGGYCCLGIFAKAMGAEEVPVMEDGDDEDEQGDLIEVVSRYDFEVNGEEVNSDDLLDTDWADTFGISNHHQSFFSALNDGSNFSLTEEEHPLYVVLQSLANDPTTNHGTIHRRERLAITFRKHTFFEISQIIKTWFL